jgi:hypothetical protein
MPEKANWVLKDVTHSGSTLEAVDAESEEVKLTICKTSMSAGFKVNICKTEVEILPSHNRPTIDPRRKMWMVSVQYLKVTKLDEEDVIG